MLSVDIETNALELEDITTIHCFVIRRGTEVLHRGRGNAEACTLASLLFSVDEMLNGHNVVNFDFPVIKKVTGVDLLKRPAGYRDTLIESRVIFTNLKELDFAFSRTTRGRTMPPRLYGSHSLEAWGWRLGVYKGDFGKTANWDAWSQEMEDYCVQDTLVSDVLQAHIAAKQWSTECMELEHSFAEIIAEMSRRGFQINMTKAGKLYAQLCDEREKIRVELAEAFPSEWEEMKTPEYWYVGEDIPENRYPTKAAAWDGWESNNRGPIERGPNKRKEIPFNPGSRQQVCERLKRLGWNPASFTASGAAEVSDDILEGLPYPQAKTLARYYMIQKRIGQLAEGNQALMKVQCRGRVHGDVNTNGAVTGRCTHMRPNMAQLPRVGSPFGQEFRELMEPSPGMVLVGADASGLELRCFGHYLAPMDGGAYVKVVTTGDVHTHNQEAFGLPPGKDGRNCSKTGIYGKLYGAWFITVGEALKRLDDEHEAAAQAADVDPDDVKTLIDYGILGEKRELIDPQGLANYKRGRYASKRVEKNIQGYDKLLDLLESIIGNWKKRIPAKRDYLIGLDGRRLHVRKSNAALNTLLQSAGALLVKKATVLWYRRLSELGLVSGRDFALVAHVHDEIQVECKPQHAQLVGETFQWAIAEAGRQWNFKCPLTGEFKVGANWAETH
jgi:DNA polymerase-1